MTVPGMVSWSKTAATNATADPNVNWAEGQSPSSVNDSARAMMASVAKWRDDNAGTLTSAGGTTAYTLTTNQVFDSLANMNGCSLRVRFNALNAASPTLNVDGLGAKSIVTVPGTAVPTGSIGVNHVRDLVYDNANSCWIVVAPPVNALQAPAGTRMLFVQTTPPTGWTKDASYNNYALRIVTGAVTPAGGSAAFTTAFGSRTIAHANLPVADLSSAALTITGVTGTISMGPGASNYGNHVLSTSDTGGTSNFIRTIDGSALTATWSFSSGSIGGTVPLGGSGTAMDFAVQYVDATIGVKD